MNNSGSSKYLSLKNAAELYGYTRDHLGLMIRKGKLRGMKLGSYYVTTNDWMVEYVKNFADPGHPTARSKLSNKILAKALTGGEKIKTYQILRKDRGEIISGGINKKQNFKSFPEKSSGSYVDFSKELLEELLKSSSPLKHLTPADSVTHADFAAKGNNFKNYDFNADNNRHYVILPIRKMKNREREDILNKINSK